MFSTVDEIKFWIEPQINPYRGPLFITRSLESPVGDNIITNGGFGLVDTGKKKLLVTCQHVWKKFRDEHNQDSNVRMCVCLEQHGPVVFDQNEPIDQDSNLGVCYYNGWGVTKNLQEALSWYRKSAEQGHARAQRNLGVCYAIGAGVGKDTVKAAKWYQKAAAQGDVGAQY